MPVSSEISVTGPYSPNGSTTAFAFDFKAASAEEVVAIDGDGTVIPTTLYTVTLDGDEGGSLTFSVAPEAADYPTLYVVSEPELTQPSNFDNTGPSYNPAALTRALDRAAIRDLKLKREVDRSIRMPFGELGGALPSAAERAGGFLGFNASGVPIATTGTGDDGSVRQDLASTDAVKGPSLVNFTHAAPYSDSLGRKLKSIIYASDAPFNAVLDGVTDDTTAINAAVAELKARAGGHLVINGKALIGDILIDAQNIVVSGRGFADGVVVKDGCYGLKFTESYSWHENMTLWSEGDKDDGLDTRGVIYDKGSSIGHFVSKNTNYIGFSGLPFEAKDLIHVNFDMSLFILCNKGPEIVRAGVSGSNFTTTTNISNWYVIACNEGGSFEYVYESNIQIIIEDCAAPLQITAGRWNLRTWLEDNAAGGIVQTDALIKVDDVYSKGVNDTITRNWTPGVVAAAERGYREFKGTDITAKRYGITTEYGVDPWYLSAHGTTVNLGLKYGTSTIPVVRGDGVNLLSPSRLVAETSGELKGWSATNQGYEISGVAGAATARGIRDAGAVVTAGETYVMEWKVTTVSGATPNTARVGTDTVLNGVPFTASATGTVIAKLFAVQTTDYQSFVNAWSLAKVTSADSTVPPVLQDLLTRARRRRGEIIGTPTTGSAWAVGEFFYNSTPAAAGKIGQVCTTAGLYGTTAVFKPFGAIDA